MGVFYWFITISEPKEKPKIIRVLLVECELALLAALQGKSSSQGDWGLWAESKKVFKTARH